MAHKIPKIWNGLLVDGFTDMPVGSDKWYVWLDHHQSFCFKDVSGSFTARKERRSSGWYWYAYRRKNSILHSMYLGRTQELTLEHLQEIAGSLASVPLSSPSDQALLKRARSIRTLRRRPLRLETKLSLPPLPPNLIQRSRLIEYLNAGIDHQLTLVSAPAGYGKTTAMSEWAKRCTWPVVWLTLDENDNDITQFWSYVIAALETLHAHVGTHVLDLLYSFQPVSHESILTFLLHNIAAIPGHFVLVLDNYHVIQLPAIHEGMMFLLAHLPQHMHILLASRVDPPFPLARLRVSQDLAELHMADLAFTLNEASAFLTEAMKLDLSRETILALEDRTEGWAAGLQMAALSLQNCANIPRFVATFTGNHRYILDYLADEVFQYQPVHLQSFLLQTSLLERLNSALCETLTGVCESQQQLEQLEKAHLFLVPLDHQHGWYRYHQLFRDFLYARLQRLNPDLVPLLHLRACDWYERNGFIDEAIAHALAAPDFERATSLITRVGEAMLSRGEVTLLLHWFDKLPDDFVCSRPHLCLLEAWARVTSGRLDMATHLVEKARHSFALASDESPAAASSSREDAHHSSDAFSIRGELAAIEAYIAASRGDVLQVRTVAQEALEYLKEEHLYLRSMVTLHLGFAHALCGDLAAAGSKFVEASVVSSLIGNMALSTIARCSLALMQIVQGKLHQAAHTYQQALRFAGEKGPHPIPVAGMAYVGLAGVLYEWNDLDGSEGHLRAGIALSEQWGNREVLAYGHAILALVKLAQKDLGTACEQIVQAEQLVQQGQVPLWCISLVSAYRVRLWLAQGNVLAAEHVAQNSFLGEFAPATFARMYLAQQQYEKALETLNNHLPFIEATEQMGRVLEALILQALAYHQQGEESKAIPLLNRALTLAEPQENIRFFVDEGMPMIALLSKTISLLQKKQRSAKPYLLKYARKVLAASHLQEQDRSPKTGSHSPHTSSGLIEPLSKRELEVVKYIASGLSNQEIAEQMIVAESTIQWHIKNIYSKLHIHNRVQVVVYAREFNFS